MSTTKEDLDLLTAALVAQTEIPPLEAQVAKALPMPILLVAELTKGRRSKSLSDPRALASPLLCLSFSVDSTVLQGIAVWQMAQTMVI